MEEVKAYNKRRSCLNICSLCKHNLDNEPRQWWGECYDCVGDHSRFELHHNCENIENFNREDEQMFTRVNYEIIHGTIKTRNKPKPCIILCFPGVGKKEIVQKLKNTSIHMLDLERTDEHPDVYIEEIKSYCPDDIDIMLISAEKEIRKAVYEDEFLFRNYPIYICYPDKKFKEEFIRRSIEDGTFVDKENFDKWVDDIEQESYFFPLKLSYSGDRLMNRLYVLPTSISWNIKSRNKE